MCGIVGLFLKDKSLEPKLGEMTSTMLATMCDRGPDSAGFAVYGSPAPGKAKITVQSADADKDFAGLAEALGAEPIEVVANAFNYMALLESAVARPEIDAALIRLREGSIPRATLYSGPLSADSDIVTLGYPGNVDRALAKTADDKMFGVKRS